MAVTQTVRLGLTRWGAGSDPDTRAQNDADNAALEALAAILLVGAFNDRPAAGVAQRLYLVWDPADSTHHRQLYADSGPGGAPSWASLNPPVSDVSTLVAMIPGV